MKRNSTTIFIESTGATTSLPWLGSEPDFSGIPEPTLSVILSAWEDGKDTIEVVSDPEPFVEVKEPDWEGLKNSNLGGILAPVYQRLTASAMSSAAMSTAQNQIMLVILYVKDQDALSAGINLLTEHAGYNFTQEEKDIWNQTVSSLNFSEQVFL